MPNKRNINSSEKLFARGMCNQTSLQRHAPPQSNQILPPPEQNNKSTHHPAQIPHPWALGELHQRPGAVYKSTRPLCFSACRIQFQSGKTWNLHVGGVPFPNVCNVPPYVPTGCGCEVLIEKRTPLPAGPLATRQTISRDVGTYVPGKRATSAVVCHAIAPLPSIAL